MDFSSGGTLLTAPPYPKKFSKPLAVEPTFIFPDSIAIEASNTFFTIPDQFISIVEYKNDKKLSTDDWAEVINECIKEVKAGKYNNFTSLCRN